MLGCPLGVPQLFDCREGQVSFRPNRGKGRNYIRDFRRRITARSVGVRSGDLVTRRKTGELTDRFDARSDSTKAFGAVERNIRFAKLCFTRCGTHHENPRAPQFLLSLVISRQTCPLGRLACESKIETMSEKSDPATREREDDVQYRQDNPACTDYLRTRNCSHIANRRHHNFSYRSKSLLECKCLSLYTSSVNSHLHDVKED